MWCQLAQANDQRVAGRHHARPVLAVGWRVLEFGHAKDLVVVKHATTTQRPMCLTKTSATWFAVLVRRSKVPSTTADVQTFLRVIATVRATWWMLWARAEGHARQTRTATAFATTGTPAWARRTNAASWSRSIYGCGRQRPEGACDCAGNVEDILSVGQLCGGARPTKTATCICDDEDDCVGEYDGCGVCNGPGPVLDAVATTFLRATVIATGTS